MFIKRLFLIKKANNYRNFSLIHRHEFEFINNEVSVSIIQGDIGATGAVASVQNISVHEYNVQYINYIKNK